MDSNLPTTLPSTGRAPYLTVNPSQTRKLGEILAKEILKTKPRKDAFLLGLEGDLGGGKTTFLQGFAKGLGIKQKILSPTFLIIKKFSIFNFKFSHFYHIDCYRIEKPKEILDLGFKEIISNPQNIVAVEWADRVREIMPENTIWITSQFINKNRRKISIKK